MWPSCAPLSFASYSIMHIDSTRFLDSPALEACSLVQFVVLFSRQMGRKYIYIYTHIYITVFTAMLHDQEHSRSFSFHEIFNEGTKEKKNACMYIAFAYDLILLFFVTWVSQIYLVASIESILKEHRWSRGWNLDEEESYSKNRYLDP